MRCEPKTELQRFPCASSSADTRDASSLHSTESCIPMLMFSPRVFARERQREQALEVVLFGAIDERRDDRRGQRGVERAEHDAGDEPRIDIDLLSDARSRMHDAHASWVLLEARNQIADA